jgi:hypothetical protein
MAKSTREYHLKSNKWTTIAKNYSLRSRVVYAEVWAPRVASWRRIGIFPGYGKFRRYLSASLPFGILQVKFRENRTCTVHIGEKSAETKPEHFPE